MNAQRPPLRQPPHEATPPIARASIWSPSPAPVAPMQIRAPLVTRRFDISWLNSAGEVDAATRIAPAAPDFEEAAAAFARGTLIATQGGPVAVEDLVPGMIAATAEGRMEPIMWIGSINLFAPRGNDDAAPVTLTRITAESFGMARPMTDVVLGPRARLLLRDARCRPFAHSDTAFAPARAFVDGISVIEVRPAAPVTMFHIALRRHGTLRAAGLEVEAFHPGPARAELTDPQLAGYYLSLFPHITTLGDFGPMIHPRLSSADVAAM